VQAYHQNNTGHLGEKRGGLYLRRGGSYGSALALSHELGSSILNFALLIDNSHAVVSKKSVQDNQALIKSRQTTFMAVFRILRKFFSFFRNFGNWREC
jgi:hypothetical protein